MSLPVLTPASKSINVLPVTGSEGDVNSPSLIRSILILLRHFTILLSCLAQQIKLRMFTES